MPVLYPVRPVVTQPAGDQSARPGGQKAPAAHCRIRGSVARPLPDTALWPPHYCKLSSERDDLSSERDDGKERIIR
jgi:hypothetical protein